MMSYDTGVLCVVLLAGLCNGYYIHTEPVHFSQHPLSQAVMINSSLKLTCPLAVSNATDSYLPPLETYWYHDGQRLETVGPELIISSVQPEHSGVYRCWVVDGNSTDVFPVPMVTLSQAAQVEVVDDRTILNQSSHLCGNLLLQCLERGAAHLHRAFSVSWYRNGAPINTSNNESYFVTDFGELHIIRVLGSPQSQTGVYRCQADQFILAEHNISLCNQTESPGTGSSLVHLDASGSLLTAGTSLRLVCLLSNSHGHSDTSWTRDGQPLVSTGGGVGGSQVLTVREDLVFISNTMVHDSGQYCCSLTGHTGCTNITVLDAVSGSVNDSIIFNTNLPMNLSCAPKGGAPVQWYHSGVLVNTTHQVNHTVTGTGQDELGVYQCFIQGLLAPSMVQYRVVPFGISNPPRDMKYTILSPERSDFVSAGINWSIPLYTGGLEPSSLSYSIQIFVMDTFLKSDTTVDSYFEDNFRGTFKYRAKVAVLNANNTLVSEYSLLSFAVDSFYDNLPRPPLLSVNCSSNNTPVLHWSAVAYGKLYPHMLCAQYTCNSNYDNDTSVSDCNMLDPSSKDDEGIVTAFAGSSCVFTAWQVTTSATSTTSVVASGSVSVVSTSCGEQESTSHTVQKTSTIIMTSLLSPQATTTAPLTSVDTVTSGTIIITSLRSPQVTTTASTTSVGTVTSGSVTPTLTPTEQRTTSAPVPMSAHVISPSNTSTIGNTSNPTPVNLLLIAILIPLLLVIVLSALIFTVIITVFCAVMNKRSRKYDFRNEDDKLASIEPFNDSFDNASLHTQCQYLDQQDSSTSLNVWPGGDLKTKENCNSDLVDIQLDRNIPRADSEEEEEEELPELRHLPAHSSHGGTLSSHTTDTSISSRKTSDSSAVSSASSRKTSHMSDISSCSLLSEYGTTGKTGYITVDSSGVYSDTSYNSTQYRPKEEDIHSMWSSPGHASMTSTASAATESNV